MARNYKPRYEKNFYDATLNIVAGAKHSNYVDAFHRHAAKKVPLRNMTDRIRWPVNAAGVGKIARDAVIYGVRNTNICQPVTIETLTSRMGVAGAISQWTVLMEKPLSARKRARAKAFVQMHEQILSMNGPYQQD